jgi:hypothetical protein
MKLDDETLESLARLKRNNDGRRLMNWLNIWLSEANRDTELPPDALMHNAGVRSALQRILDEIDQAESTLVRRRTPQKGSKF